MMKTLYLIRHAKSSWDNPALPDVDRPLNKRGVNDAPLMGRRLKQRNILPDLLLTSPAVRARATCHAIADEIGFPKHKIATDKNLYHAGETDILQILQRLDNKHAQVMIFGHNPGLTEFANLLANARIDNIPTCGIVACSLDVQTWNETDTGKGSVIFFDYPKKNA